MPTTRPRHVLTETDDLAEAIDDAARRWPDDRRSRAKLLLHLVHEGHRAVMAGRDAAVSERQEAVLRTAGAGTGLYGDGYLEQLREDWPT